MSRTKSELEKVEAWLKAQGESVADNLHELKYMLVHDTDSAAACCALCQCDPEKLKKELEGL